MTTNYFLGEIGSTFSRAFTLLKRKNKDYGNHEDPLKNFNASLMIGVEPEKAILIRVSDKISRINTLLARKAEVKDEQIEDTIIDAINYLAIMNTMLKGEPEKSKPDQFIRPMQFRRINNLDPLAPSIRN